MGDRYGPMVVTREPATLDELRGPDDRRPRHADDGLPDAPALPGQGRLDGRSCPSTRSSRPSPRGEVDAGLIIHEGQLYYGDQGLHLVVDLGVWWLEQTGLPLPLGGNVVRRDLGDEPSREIARLLKASIATPWTTARRRSTTPCSTPATWTPPWPTGSSACTSTMDARLRPPGPRGGPDPARAGRGSGFSPRAALTYNSSDDGRAAGPGRRSRPRDGPRLGSR